MKKIFVTIFIILFLFFIMNTNNIYANLQDNINNSNVGKEFNSAIVPNYSAPFNIRSPISKVFGIVLTVLQVAAMAGVIYAGIRYMYASSDQRADLKKSMISLIIGMVIVFAGSTVVQIVINLFNDVTNIY